MKELLKQIASLSPEDRYDLLCYLSLKYGDDLGKAKIYSWWPNALKDASQQLKDMLEDK